MVIKSLEGMIRTLLKRFLGIKGHRDIFLLLAYRKNFARGIELMKVSNSQISQDVFVLLELASKGKNESGFFVEFGAADGKIHSNTYILEKKFGWSGILAEPGLTWQKALVVNRECQIDFRCVHSYSGSRLEFDETADPLFSTRHQYLHSDKHEFKRNDSRKYEVESISLSDLLVAHNSPTMIDYLSIDTEGSELEILSTFDFKKYRIGIISVEHNFETNREKIYDLLTANGYTRKHRYISLFDDWYVLDSNK